MAIRSYSELRDAATAPIEGVRDVAPRAHTRAACRAPAVEAVVDDVDVLVVAQIHHGGRAGGHRVGFVRERFQFDALGGGRVILAHVCGVVLIDDVGLNDGSLDDGRHNVSSHDGLGRDDGSLDGGGLEGGLGIGFS